MTTRIHAPFTSEQVEAINRYQTRGAFHPFTCGKCRGPGNELVANKEGLGCAKCSDYSQDWCFAFMADDSSILEG